MSSIEAEIRELIRSKTSGIMIYQGHERWFSPHLLGVTTDGRLVTHAFQWGGSSSQGQVSPEKGAGWRFFYLSEVEMQRGDSTMWYPEELKKSEGDYKPPKFIAEVLEIVGNS